MKLLQRLLRLIVPRPRRHTRPITQPRRVAEQLHLGLTVPSRNLPS